MVLIAGYPIINDPLYNHPAWGPDKGCKGTGITSIDEVWLVKVYMIYNCYMCMHNCLRSIHSTLHIETSSH